MKVNWPLLRERFNIVEYIGKYVQLRRSGKNYTGLCPFHHEKTASFSVSEERQRFRCFGCGVGGDLVEFLSRYLKESPMDVLTALEKEKGVKLVERDRDWERKQAERARQIEMNRKAALFFIHHLYKSAEGARALAYLKDRSMPLGVAKNFALGYAPPEWDRLSRYLEKEGYGRREIDASGLVSVGSSGVRDFFRNRLMFPIVNRHAEVIGFGGRALDDNPPKYLNTSENPLFSKRRNLFGINAAHAAISETRTVFIAEGYMDCIMMHHAGYTNTVATLGTAITEEQVKMLKEKVDTFNLIYDGDSAGIKAALRAAEVFMNQGYPARIVMLPEGEDPASLVEAGRAGDLAAAVDNSQTTIDFLIHFYTMKYSLRTAEGLRSFMHGIGAHVRNIENVLEREVLLAELSRRLNKPVELLLDMMGRDDAPRQQDAVVPQVAVSRNERIIVGYVIAHRDMAYLVDDHVRAEMSPLSIELLDAVRAGGLDELSEDAVMLHDSLSMHDDGADDDVRNEEFEQALLHFRKRHIRRRKEELAEEIHRAEQAGDMDVVRRLIGEKTDLTLWEKKLSRGFKPHERTESDET